MKILQRQKQQSKEDVALTQKVGKTRIPIEQANGGMKRSTCFFDTKIKIVQIGLANLIFEASYLLCNFKLPFIQGRSKFADDSADRPCRAKIFWGGASDDELVEIRPFVVLEGTDTEVKRWYELRGLDRNEHLTATEISELVLDEDWPAKLREKHLQALDDAAAI